MRRLSHAFRERWQVMHAMLGRHLPECRVWPSVGGTACWIEAPRGLDARETERRAAADSILIEPGDIHFLADPAPRNCFRLGFSSIPVDRIEPGLRKLGDVIRGQMQELGPAIRRP
jgi:GntR family transcriptional regulator/MocR family aminotransferase